jgi:hypothetical protein
MGSVLVDVGEGISALSSGSGWSYILLVAPGMQVGGELRVVLVGVVGEVVVSCM